MKIILSFFFILFSGVAFAGQFSSELQLDDKGYHLRITMQFEQGLDLPQIREIFESETLAAEFNPNIVSVRKEILSFDTYRQHLKIRPLLKKTKLISLCHEKKSEVLWQRDCQLDTNVADGGEFMSWKKDRVTCRGGTAGVMGPSCILLIQGLSKDISILGLKAIDKRRFMLLAKQDAIKIFARLWSYADHGGVSTRYSNAKVEESNLFRQINSIKNLALNWQLPDQKINLATSFEY